MTRTQTLKRTLAGATSLLAFTVAGGAFAQAMQFDIDAQPLNTALLEFGEQSGIDVAAPRDVLNGKTSPAVRGEMEPEEALEKILAGSGLKSNELPTGAYTITLAGASLGEGSIEAQPFRVASLIQEDDEPVALENRDDDELEEQEDVIVVTGTQIRGQAPVGSPLITFDREDIEATGLATTQDLLRTLPQNFNGGANEGVQGVEAPVEATGNEAIFGSAPNLRGLGADSTLTLVNGRRVAPSSDGGFVDISMIPLSAVERVEVLPDGASAIYGADAIGGVINFVLRNDFEGAETKLRYGTVTDGGHDTVLAGQSFGTVWDGGNAFLAYEYFNQDFLLASERPFSASDDLRPFGGDDFRLPFANPGTILVADQSFAIPIGQDGTSLTPTDFSAGTENLGTQNEGSSLLPSQERHSFFLTVNQELAEGFELFVQGQYSDRDFESKGRPEIATLSVPSTNPFFVDPSSSGASSVSVNYSFIDDLGPQFFDGNATAYSISAGVTKDLFGDWQFEASGNYAKNENEAVDRNILNDALVVDALNDPNPSSALNVFGDGSFSSFSTLQNIRGFFESRTDFTLWSFDTKLDGTLFAMPGGDVKLAFGGHYREEDFVSGGRTFTNSFTPIERGERKEGRNIWAVFSEAVVPIIGPENRLPGIERLTLSGAVRYERYSDVGSTTNPKLGLSWTIVDGLDIRSSFGTSFRAPLLTEQDTSINGAFIFPFLLPGDDSPSNIMFVSGTNENLSPETATTWTVGFDYSPPKVSGLRFSGTYFDVDYTNRINGINLFEVINNQDQFPTLITRDPDPETVRQLFENSPRTANALGIGFDEVEVIFNTRRTNLATVKVSGLDLSGSYTFDTGIGEWSLSSSASYLFDFKEGASEDSPLFETVDTVLDPAALRLRASALWKRNGLSAGVFANHVGGYTDDFGQEERDIDSWTTFDMRVSYDFSPSSGSSSIFSDLRASLSVFNAFNELPPFVNAQGLGFDPANADPRGRFVALELVKAW